MTALERIKKIEDEMRSFNVPVHYHSSEWTEFLIKAFKVVWGLIDAQQEEIEKAFEERMKE